MAKKHTPSRPVPGGTYGNVAYKYDYYGDVAVAPAPQYAPQTTPRVAPAPRVKEKTVARPMPHAPARVRVRVREQQPVAPFAVIGLAVAAVLAVALLFGYIQLNSVYAETVQLQSQLSSLRSEGADLEAQYEEAFDLDTLQRAAAANALTTPDSAQTVYIDLSEGDNAVVYTTAENPTGLMAALQSVGAFLSDALEFFR